MALAFNQGKPTLTSEQLQIQASKLRVLAVEHMQKHQKQYDKHWKPVPDDNSSMWAGEQPPASFQEYLGLIPKRNVWIDEFLWNSLSERLGCPVLVWHFDSHSATWLRAVFAPWWEDDTAQSTKGQRPVCVALRNQHDQAVLPQTTDIHIPESWMWASAPRSPGALKGAGPGSLSIPSRTPSRPGKPRGPNSVLTFPPSTPARKPRPGPLPKSCASKPRIGAAATDSPQALNSQKRHVTVPSERPGTVQRRKASSLAPEPPVVVRRKLQGKQKGFVCLKDLRPPGKRGDSFKYKASFSQASKDTSQGLHLDCSESNLKATNPHAKVQCKLWTCNLCQLRIEAPTGKLVSNRRSRHIASCHPGVDTSIFTSNKPKVEILMQPLPTQDRGAYWQARQQSALSSYCKLPSWG